MSRYMIKPMKGKSFGVNAKSKSMAAIEGANRLKKMGKPMKGFSVRKG